MTQPRPEDWDRFFLIAAGHTAFQLLWSGIELGLFDRLAAEPGQTLEQLATRLGLQPYPARVLLVGLTAIGLVEKEGEGYRNAPVADAALVSGRPGYLAPVLGWQAHIVYPGVMDLLPSLREGRNVGLERFAGSGATLYQRLASTPKLEQIFQTAMSSLSQCANQHVATALDWGRFRHVVDAGGGDGTNAIALATRFPTLRVTVMDSPTVCAIAREKISAAGLSDRVSTLHGDFRVTPFPVDADAVLFCHIFTIFSMAHNRETLAKCARELPRGGSVVLFNMMGADDDSGPISTALGSPYFLAIATGEGMLHAGKDYAAALREAGFVELQRITGLPLDHGMLVGTKR